MSELRVLLALLPLAFLALDIPQKTRVALCWLSVSIGFIWLGYFLLLKQDSMLHWAILLPFFGLVVADLIREKRIAPFTLMSVIFVSLASMTPDFGAIIIFLAFSDFFLEVEFFSKGNVEQKGRAIKNIYRSLLSLFPLGIAVTLQVNGEILNILAAMTIALRVFSWPVFHWVSEEVSPFFRLVVGAVSGFVLWHALDFSAQPEWPFIWLIVAAVLSFGVEEVEIYIALTLGLFSLSPQLGLLGIGLWPLTLNRGLTSYIIYLFIGLGGTLIADSSSKVIVENASYVVSFVTAVLIARSLVGSKIKIRVWYRELTDIFIAALVIAPFVYFNPVVIPTVNAIGLSFGGVFLSAYIIGKVLLIRKPKLFEKMRHFKKSKNVLFFRSVEFLRERVGPPPMIPQRPFLVRFFDILDSESHLIWLLGVLGLALWWGVK